MVHEILKCSDFVYLKDILNEEIQLFKNKSKIRIDDGT